MKLMMWPTRDTTQRWAIRVFANQTWESPMALIAGFERVGMERPRVHGSVECTYTIFEAANGQKYLQLNTFGSRDRQLPGKQSQTIQLNQESAIKLLKILTSEFA
jgi:hypothetical protein